MQSSTHRMHGSMHLTLRLQEHRTHRSTHAATIARQQTRTHTRADTHPAAAVVGAGRLEDLERVGDAGAAGRGASGTAHPEVHPEVPRGSVLL